MVSGQIKAADQKYCQNEKMRVWMIFVRILYSNGLGFYLWSRRAFANRMNPNLSKRGKELYTFSLDGTYKSFNYRRKEVNQGSIAPFQMNGMEEEGIYFVFLFPF